MNRQVELPLDREHVYVLNEDPLGGQSVSEFYGCLECDMAYSVVYLVEDEEHVTCPHCDPAGWTAIAVDAPMQQRGEA